MIEDVEKSVENEHEQISIHFHEPKIIVGIEWIFEGLHKYVCLVSEMEPVCCCADR